MFGKAFVIVLIATVFVQSESRYYLAGDQVRGYIDDAKDALQKLVDKITDSISEAVQQITFVGKDLPIYADEIAEQYSFKVQQEFKKLGEQMSQIKEDAKAAGTDISDCLQGREANFTELPGIYTGNIAKCVKDKVSEGKAIVDNSTKAVQKNIDEVNKIKSELDECGGGVESLACVTRVMAKIAAQSANIPVKISTETTRAVKLIATLKPSLEECAKGNALQMVIEGQKIIEDITKCVSEKNK